MLSVPRAEVGVGVWFVGSTGPSNVSQGVCSHPSSMANHETPAINQSLTRVWKVVSRDEMKDQARIINVFPYLRG